MKPRFPCLALAALALATAPSVATATTCKRLIDTDSNLMSVVSMIAGDSDAVTEIAANLKPIDTAYPWLSTCVASIDPVTVYATAALSSGYASCNKTISSFFMPSSISDASLRDSLCPFYGDTLMPCINNVVVQAVVDAMAGTGGCCDDMKAKIAASFGSDLKTVIADMLTKLGNMACTVKSFTNAAGAKTTQSCAVAFAGAFMSPSTSEHWLSLIQLPTDQACKAVNGQPFTTTLGKSTQFAWTSLGIESLGICYEPVSAVVKMLGAYPMMASMSTTVGGVTVSMADVFTTGTCLKSGSIFSWLLDSGSFAMTWARAFDDAWASTVGGSGSGGGMPLGGNATVFLRDAVTSYQGVLPAMCLHLASGQTCDYGSATTVVAFKASTTTAASGAPSLLLGVAFAATTIVASFSIM